MVVIVSGAVRYLALRSYSLKYAAWLAGHGRLEKALMHVELVVGFLNPNDIKHFPVFPARKREIPFVAVNRLFRFWGA